MSNSTESKNENIFAVPDSAPTSAGADFFAQHLDDLTWGVGQEVLARQVEELSEMIIEAVGKSHDSEVWRTSDIFRETGLPEVSDAINWAQRHFRSKSDYARNIEKSNSRTSTEAALCRYVDNFTCYLSDLLRLLFEKYPESLTNSESTVSVKDVFAYSNFNALLSSLAERTISDLSFRGFGEIEAYYMRRFKFDLIPTASQRESVTYSIAARNLLVHRRGIIDERFVAMAGKNPDHRIGYRLDISKRIWHDLIPGILRSVHDIDVRAAAKFGLQQAFVLTARKNYK